MQYISPSLLVATVIDHLSIFDNVLDVEHVQIPLNHSFLDMGEEFIVTGAPKMLNFLRNDCII
jgi:hypothetical protein